MSIIDTVIILFLLLGAVLGFKKGVIQSIVSFVGTILVVILSFWLKNPLSVFLYTYLPFFNFSISAINILVYEAIAFLIVFALLSTILRIILKISGMVELLLKFTIVLAIPSKILGAIFGFLEYYIFIFVILFVFSLCNIDSELLQESKLAEQILSHSPVISTIVEDSYNAVKTFTDINKKEESIEKKNEEAIEVLLKYHMISEENLNRLNQKKKFNIPNLDQIIKNSTKGEKDND